MAYKIKGAKPRTITYNRSDDSVTADGIRIPFSALKRQELISAVSQKFSLGGPQLMYLQNGDLMNALVTGTAPVDSRGEPATDKQVWKLRQLGYALGNAYYSKPVADLTKKEASGIISAMVDKPAKPIEATPEYEVERIPAKSETTPIDVDLSEYVKTVDFDAAIELQNEAFDGLQKAYERLVAGKPKVINILGKPTVKIDKQTHESFEDILLSVQAGNNGGLWPLLVGPAGTGKSTIGEHCAMALSIPFYPFSCGPTKTETALTGYMNANGVYVSTDFRKAYEHGGMFVVDEMDASHPGVLTSLNNALANRVMQFPDGMVNRHADFYCIGTANTFGTGATRQYVGRNQLDAATLDRFCTENVEYDVSLERAIATAIVPDDAERLLAYIWQVRANVVREGAHMIVGTRAIVGSAHQIALGRNMHDALERCLWKGTPADVRAVVA